MFEVDKTERRSKGGNKEMSKEEIEDIKREIWEQTSLEYHLRMRGR